MNVPDGIMLCALLFRFEAIGMWSSGPKPVLMKISAETRDTAVRFLEALPDNKATPKIAPDSDGDLDVVWEDNDSFLSVIVKGSKIYASMYSGHESTIIVNGLEFGADQAIPDEILSAIPHIKTSAHA